MILEDYNRVQDWAKKDTPVVRPHIPEQCWYEPVDKNCPIVPHLEREEQLFEYILQSPEQCYSSSECTEPHYCGLLHREN